MKKINQFINKTPELIYIMLGVVGFAVIGIIYDSLDTMFKIFLGVVVFGILIGLISYIIKIFSNNR